MKKPALIGIALLVLLAGGGTAWWAFAKPEPTRAPATVAVTPGGSFRIGRKAVGLEIAPLGELWWPMYFNGGIAIHGSPSVPAYPASHGCIRIPMYAAPTFYNEVPAGTRVHVLNSPEAWGETWPRILS